MWLLQLYIFFVNVFFSLMFTIDAAAAWLDGMEDVNTA